MTQRKSNNNEHRAKKPPRIELGFDHEQRKRFMSAKEKLSAENAKDLVIKLLDKADL